MSFENVQLWFAKDSTDNIVTINEVNKNKKDTYYCPLCNSEVIPRQGEINSWCFAHEDKSKCNSESMIHFWVKNKLIEKGDKFVVYSDRKREYICKEIYVEKAYKVGENTYKPDLTILTESGETIHFEIEHTNQKKIEDYIDIWIELGHIIVEVDTKMIINSMSERIPVFKAKYYDGKCFNSITKGENKTYYDIIGAYKERIIENKEYDKQKKDVERLDWLWRDIQKYKQGIVDIDYITHLIQSIESINSRNVAINILKKSNCNQVIKDYVEVSKQRISKEINEVIYEINSNYNNRLAYSIIVPNSIYDRFYTGFNIIIRTKQGIYITNKRALTNIITKKDIQDNLDMKLLNFDESIEILNDRYNFSKVAKGLYKYEYPYLNAYYSEYYKDYRFYPNNFPHVDGRSFLTTKKYNSTEEILNYLCFDESVIFSKQEVECLNNINKELKEYFKEKDLNIYCSIFKGYEFNVSIVCNDYHDRVYYKSKKEINLNNLFDILKNIIHNKYLFYKNLTEKKANISNLANKINDRYQKHVIGNWSIRFIQSSIGDSIWVEKGGYVKNTFESGIIDKYYKDEITIQDFENYLTEKISKFIRESIYKEAIIND